MPCSNQFSDKTFPWTSKQIFYSENSKEDVFSFSLSSAMAKEISFLMLERKNHISLSSKSPSVLESDFIYLVYLLLLMFITQ